MARFCGIVGPTGSGKSRSIINLKPEETFVICIADPDLPFKGALAKYNRKNKNYCKADSYAHVLSALEAIDSTLINVKTVVIDDMIYLLSDDFFSRAKEQGYDKFVDVAVNFQAVLNKIKRMRADITVIGLLHADNIESNGKIIGKKLRLMGKLIEEKYSPIEQMTICLWACPGIKQEDQSSFKNTIKLSDETVRIVGAGKNVKEISKDMSGMTISRGDAIAHGVEYRFLTNRAWIDGVEYPAKSPEEMFDELFIPNDLAIVVEKIKEYYYN